MRTKGGYLFSIFLTILLAISINSKAQDGVGAIKKLEERVKVNGHVFYIHPVKKGETIYSLCKQYETTHEELLKFNPELADGLKEGQVIRIPDNIQQADQEAVSQSTSSEKKTHLVKRKETLYSIAQQYGCTVNDILRVNPTLGENIQKGQTIIIPSPSTVAKGDVNVSKEEVKDIIGEGSITYYSVKKGETVTSIAKRCSVSEEDLVALNPDAFKANELMEGAILRIPSRKISTDEAALPLEEKKDSVKSSIFYSSSASNTYQYRKGVSFNIALLLPLNGKNRGAGDQLSSGAITNQNYLEFYEGALLAVDSLKRAGVSLEISTFNVSDNVSLAATLNSSDLHDANLIIGPVQENLMEQASIVAKQRGIPIVYPNLGKMKSEEMLDNPYLIPLKTSEETAKSFLLKDVCASDNRNVILVHHDTVDTTMYKTYKQELDSNSCHYKQFVLRFPMTQDALSNMLSQQQENHIVVAFNRSAWVADMLSTLVAISVKKKLNLHVYGIPQWKKISNIPTSYFYNLNMRTVQPFFVDYASSEVKKFISDYRFYYKGEPSNYAFYGYDVMFYFAEAMKTYGTNFLPYLPTAPKKELLQSKIQFEKSPYGGIENVGVYLLEYTPNFDIIRK